MSRIPSLFRGGTYVLLGQIGTQFLSLIRNFIVARLITPHDFGVAVTFATTMSLLTLATDLGVDKFIVQAWDGDDSDLQANAHLMMVVRGAIAGLVLFAAAPFIAGLFGVPDATWAYRCLGLVPLIVGFAHLDPTRAYRRLVFGRDVSVNFFAQVASVVTAVSVALVTPDYRAMLWGVIVQSVAYTALTHVLSDRPYQIFYTLEWFRRMAKFSWPLTVNGVALFIAGQGDRVAVGGFLGVHALAKYGAPALIASSFSSLLIKLVSTLGLPLLSAAPDDPVEFDRLHGLLGAIIGLGALMLAIPFMFLGRIVVTAVYGAQYLGPSELYVFMGFGLGMFIFGYWAAVAALALGDTKNVMTINIARFSGLAVALPLMIYAHGGLVALAAAMALGELIGTTSGLVRLRIVLGRSNSVPILKVAVFYLSLMWSALVALAMSSQSGALGILVGSFCLALCVTVNALVSKDVRNVLTLAVTQVCRIAMAAIE